MPWSVRPAASSADRCGVTSINGRSPGTALPPRRNAASAPASDSTRRLTATGISNVCPAMSKRIMASARAL